MNNSTGADYRFDESIAHTAAYLHSPIVEYAKSVEVTRIFDIGCGNGYLCRRLADEGFEVGGCDPSDSGIEVAQKLVPTGKFFTLAFMMIPPGLALSGTWWSRQKLSNTYFIRAAFRHLRVRFSAREESSSYLPLITGGPKTS